MRGTYQFVAMTCVMLSAVAAIAQFQVNTQVVNPGAAGSVRYSNAYGGQPYGGQSYGGQPYGGQSYGGQQLLPSETRNQAFQSGVTRSEIRMQAAAVGPLRRKGHRRTSRRRTSRVKAIERRRRTRWDRSTMSRKHPALRRRSIPI